MWGLVGVAGSCDIIIMWGLVGVAGSCDNVVVLFSDALLCYKNAFNVCKPSTNGMILSVWSV